MRLINTEEITFKEFPTTSLPPYGSLSYAILSHCWGSPADESTLGDVQNRRNLPTFDDSKIARFCRVARCDGLLWAWIDTCCIDKTSSAELTESINSMWSYYENARRCYVFMADVKYGESNFHESRWWKRGWTLQELLAPSEVFFYDREWKYLGSKHELAAEIENITKIPSTVLVDGKEILRWSVAQRLSWAAGRETLRIEDRAYSLLGVFRINMPLLYGEREKAFQRLQLEILQKYPDQSVLAWHASTMDSQSVLATSPDNFSPCSNMAIVNSAARRYKDFNPRERRPPRITSWGIELLADARKLRPKGKVDIDLRYEGFLWALTLTASRNGKIVDLPCTLILVKCGPARFSYKRYHAIHQTEENMLVRLKRDFEVGDPEWNQLFYLTFDHDLLI